MKHFTFVFWLILVCVVPGFAQLTPDVWQPLTVYGGDRQTVFVSSKGTVFTSYSIGGVWRSNNHRFTGDGYTNTEDFKSVSAVSSDVDRFTDVGLLFWTEIAASAGSTIYACGTNSGIWQSTDDGKTWSALKLDDATQDTSNYVYESIAARSENQLFVTFRKRGSALSTSFDGVVELKKAGTIWQVIQHPINKTSQMTFTVPIRQAVHLSHQL